MLVIILFMRVKLLVAQLCLTFCNSMDCSLPGFSVHGVLQARILEWVAMPFSRWFYQLKDWTQVSHIVCRFFTIWATQEALILCIVFQNILSLIDTNDEIEVCNYYSAINLNILRKGSQLALIEAYNVLRHYTWVLTWPQEWFYYYHLPQEKFQTEIFEQS